MCYAIPGKIVAVALEDATIDYGGIRKKANISLIDCNIGEYVLVHAGFAIQKVGKEAAEKSLKLLSELE